jgi:hypothetical protein
VLGAFTEPEDGDRIWDPLPSYSAHKVFFELKGVDPMPQYVFHTLFDHLPAAQPDGRTISRLRSGIPGYPQTLCVVYRER